MDSLTNALKGSVEFLNIVWTKVIGENQNSKHASNELPSSEIYWRSLNSSHFQVQDLTNHLDHAMIRDFF